MNSDIYDSSKEIERIQQFKKKKKMNFQVIWLHHITIYRCLFNPRKTVITFGIFIGRW